MKKYKIFTTVRVGWTYEVKAEDEKEAEEKWEHGEYTKAKYNKDYACEGDEEIIEIEEITE